MPAIDYLEPNDKIMIEMGISMLFAFIWGWAATKIAVPISIRYDIIDMPEKRKLHSEATPRGGGIVLWSGLLLFILLCHGRTDVNLVLFAWCASAVSVSYTHLMSWPYRRESRALCVVRKCSIYGWVFGRHEKFVTNLEAHLAFACLNYSFDQMCIRDRILFVYSSFPAWAMMFR